MVFHDLLILKYVSAPQRVESTGSQVNSTPPSMGLGDYLDISVFTDDYGFLHSQRSA